MSVYQVEEWYINIEVPEDKVKAVIGWLNNNTPVCCEVNWFDNELTIDNFDSERLAEDVNEQIDDLINGEGDLNE